MVDLLPTVRPNTHNFNYFWFFYFFIFFFFFFFFVDLINGFWQPYFLCVREGNLKLTQKAGFGEVKVFSFIFKSIFSTGWSWLERKRQGQVNSETWQGNVEAHSLLFFYFIFYFYLCSLYFVHTKFYLGRGEADS